MKENNIRIALNVARQNLGKTGANPSVGAVLVSGDLSFTGVTGINGSPHAEAAVIEKARNYGFMREDFEKSTIYVTLEPCCHYGKNPPCTQNIIDSGIKNVVVAVQDPDPRVAGKGIEVLKQNGISVAIINSPEVADFYKPYFVFKKQKRPFVTLKIAQSLDGKIATKTGESKWITNGESREYTNFLRSKVNGILVGRNTYEQDFPKLDCRVSGLEQFSPQRFVASSLEANFSGFVRVHGSPYEILNQIYQHNVQHLLIEGGATLITSFILDDLFDELLVIQAPIFLGGDSKSSILNLNYENVPQQKLKLAEVKTFGSDVLLRFIKN